MSLQATERLATESLGRFLRRRLRERWRRLVGMGVISVVGIILLIALGVWQVHRYKYKLGVQAQIHEAQLAPPVPLGPNPSPYEKVAVTGSWLAGKAALYGDQVRNAPAGPVRGAQLIMPFRRDSGGTVLVDLGWVRGSTPRAVPVPAGRTEVSGYVRAPGRPGPFSARNDAAAGIFYTLDPKAIGAALGLHDVAPFTLVMLGPRPVAGGPVPAPALPHPPNNSLQYALTWFGLALVVVFEYVFYVRKRLLEEE
jgi:surfeit locus 1 family protein